MSMIFNLRMLSDERDDFSRVYEVDGDMTLLELHAFICEDLEYDPTNFSSFFQSDEKWDKLQEYTVADMDDNDDDGTVALSMADTAVNQVGNMRHNRLLFMFDVLAARSFYIEVQDVKSPEPAVEYPRIITAEGDVPHQMEADSLMYDESPFNDVMADFADFEGSDDDSIYDDF